MDRFVIREARTNAVYASGSPSRPLAQFQQEDGSIKTMYLSKMYGNDYNTLQYNDVNAGFQNINNANLQHGNPYPASMNPIPGPSGGVDHVYMGGAVYPSNSTFIHGGEEVRVHNTMPSIIGSEYQNLKYMGPERVNSTTYTAPARILTNNNNEAKSAFTVQTNNQPQTFNNTNTMSGHFKQKKNVDFVRQRSSELLHINKKPVVATPKAESPSDDSTSHISKADKIKALQKTGSRAFSGPVEKVLKWHKSLQDIGVFVFYEIVAKCVNISGEGCAKHLVIRDENGPAMQVVYYEIDFLLPALNVPCTIRVIGRIMPGTCRLQAFSVRTATGDDVAILPRRAAISAHHVSKLCKEYGNN